MAFQLVINLLLAFTWMFLSGNFSFSGFFAGYVLGIAMLLLLRRFFPGGLYIRKVWAAVKLLALFFRELLLSNLAVAKAILSPRLAIRPGIVEIETDLRSDWEITLLSFLITLTPGTVTLEVAPKQDKIYVHALDIEDADELRAQIKQSFERAIMEVTR